MTSQSVQHVRRDSTGELRVGETEVPLQSVYFAYRNGDSPESIMSQYRSLTLRDVYGAISWMLDHPKDTEAYIAWADAQWDSFKMKCDANPSPVVQRLRAARLAAGQK